MEKGGVKVKETFQEQYLHNKEKKNYQEKRIFFLFFIKTLLMWFYLKIYE